MQSSPEAVSDKELIRQYLDGSEAAIQALILRYKDKVFGHIYFMVRNRAMAEDIFQETFMKVIRTLKRGKYNHQGKFLPWVNRIAHNLVVDEYRKNKKMPQFKGGEDFDIFDVLSLPEQNVEEDMVMDQIHTDVRGLIDHLPEDQKEVLIMRIYQELPFKDIADKTGVSINTALGRMRYALINLRKIIEENKIDLTVQ